MGISARTARTDVLRPVLEIALGVARSAEGRDVAPKALAPVVKMQRVGSRAWSVVDRAGDDDAFRAAIGAAVAADELDEAGRLWLTRPDGWEAELEELVEAQRSSVAADDAERELHRERRARQRAEEEREALRVQVDQLEAALAAATATVADLEARADEADERADRAVAERAEAVRQLGDERQLHQRAHGELRRLRAELDRAEAERAAGPSEPTAPPPRPMAPARPPAALDASPGPEEAVGAAAAPPFDQAAASAAVAAASTAAAALAGALEVLSGLLVPAPPPEAPVPPSGPRPDRPRRQVPPLPGGIHDDSADAADHLVRLPGCVLLIDGYNATLATWADEELPAQRRRLVTALDRLEARVAGLDATVVFDGTEERRLGRSTSRRLHVVFTDAATEADDVILEMIEQVDLDRPVVVASDDARVRAGARRRGARPIGIAQLQAVLT